MKESIYLIVTCRHLYLCMPVVKQCPCKHGHHEVVVLGWGAGSLARQNFKILILSDYAFFINHISG